MPRKIPSWISNIVLALGAVFTALYLVEGAVFVMERRRASSQPDRDPAPQIFVQAVTELRAAGVAAYPVRVPFGFLRSIPRSGPDSIEVLPLGSMSEVMTVWCRRPDTGEWVVSPSDEHGFNNPAGIWAGGAIDVMLIGDSFTQGHCVTSDETIAGQLRQLGAGRTLSLGLSINGPLLELASLSEFGQPVRPKTVYWLYSEENDLRNLEMEWASPPLRRYLTGGHSQGLIARQPEIDTIVGRRVDESLREYAERVAPAPTRPPPPAPAAGGIRRLATLGNLRARLGLYRRDPPLPAASPEQLAEVVGRADGLVQAWGGRLVFVYLPALERYAGPLFGRDDRQRDEVLGAVKALGVSVLDIHETFSGMSEPISMFVARPDGTRGVHYGPNGYQVVARAIFDDLASR